MKINIRTLRDIVNSLRLTQEQREYLVKSIMAGSNNDTTWDQIQDKPNFATVATSGNYDDLIDTPDLTVYQLIKDNSLDTDAKTIPAAINEIKGSVDSISDPYEINLTNLLSAEDSESISTAIGGIDKLNATVQDNRLIVGTISNGSVSVSIRILGNVTTLYYLLDSVVGLTLNEVAITNTSGTLSKRITTHSVLTENMVINSLESDETTLPLSAAQGKVLDNKITDLETTLEGKQDVGDYALKNQLPSYTTVPELTADYTIPANATTREYIYEISIGATIHNVTAAEGIKWIDNNLPLVEANSKLIISVINNIAVWGTVYE